MKKTYFENLHDTCIQANKNALMHKNGKAWDNKKSKTRKLYCPRGKAFKRMEQLDTSHSWRQICSGVPDLEVLVHPNCPPKQEKTMPNNITTRITLKPSGATTPECVALLKEVRKAIYNDKKKVDFSILVPAPKTEEYESGGWYNWNCTNWGTKWNAYATTEDTPDDIVEFESAWSTPQAWIDVLVRRFPNMHFKVEYADEDLGHNYGHFEFFKGMSKDSTNAIEDPTQWAENLKYGPKPWSEK